MATTGFESTTTESADSARGSPSAPPPNPDARARVRRVSSANAILFSLLAILFFSAFVLARAVEPSILGWRAGIQRAIERIELTTALLGQLSVAAGSLLALQLLISTLIESRLNVLYRIAIAPLSAGIVTLVMASATKPLPIPLVVALGALSGAIALAATIPTLLADHTRAAGLVLGISGSVALLGILMRTLALYASVAALTGLFRMTQGIASLILVLDLCACAIAAIWLARRRYAGLAIFVALLLALALFWAWLTVRAPSGSGWSVLFAKALSALARNPRPLWSPLLTFALIAFVLLAGPLAALFRRDRPYARAAIAFALLALNGTDIPVLALGITIAALLAPLAAAREMPPPPVQRSAPTGATPVSVPTPIPEAGSPDTRSQAAPTPTIASPEGATSAE